MTLRTSWMGRKRRREQHAFLLFAHSLLLGSSAPSRFNASFFSFLSLFLWCLSEILFFQILFFHRGLDSKPSFTPSRPWRRRTKKPYSGGDKPLECIPPAYGSEEPVEGAEEESITPVTLVIFCSIFFCSTSIFRPRRATRFTAFA